MSNIQQLIDKFDNFELVRDRIATILITERDFQKNLAILEGKDPELWDFSVFTEKSTPWELVENCQGKIFKQTPFVNICWDNTVPDTSSGNLISRQKHTANFNIDCYSAKNSKEESDNTISRGDSLAAIDCQRIVKLVRNILQAGIYTYLGFERNTVVLSRNITNMTMFQPQLNDRPAQHIIACRLVLTVELFEEAFQAEAVNLEFVQNKIVDDEGRTLFQADFEY